MDKGFVGDDSSSSVSYSNSSSTSNSSRDVYLKHVSRNWHKISKPVRKPSPLHPTASSTLSAPSSASAIALLDARSGQAQPQSQQPPVYNINKSDFRDVVQKLTGSPAHERVPAPTPPVAQSRPSSSRLQRIRPPPIPQIANRPPNMSQLIPRLQNDGVRAAQPFNLPPLPSVHPVAESPISAYMRFLQNSPSGSALSPLWNGSAPMGTRPEPQNDVGQRAGQPQSSLLPPTESPVSAYMRFLQNSCTSSTAPPQLSGVAPPQHPPHLHALQQQSTLPTSAASLSPFPMLPMSPLPFGCIPSPRSPYGTLFSPTGQLGLPQLPLSPFPMLPMSPLPFGCIPSPWSPYGTLFSPTGQLGLPQLPLSPTLPVPSPRWKGM